MQASDFLKIKGHLDIYLFRNPGKCVGDFDPAQHSDLLLRHIPIDNIILNLGKSEVINGLSSGTNRVLARIAMGDRGALPSDPQVPKTPDATRSGLYHEVYRQDIQTTVKTTSAETNELLFIHTFNAVDIPITSFSDQTNPVLNEIMLVMCDLITGMPLPRPAIASPAQPPPDEASFSMVTFNTVPFKAEQETAVTVRYGIFIP